MRVLVTGSRQFIERPVIYRALDEAWEAWEARHARRQRGEVLGLDTREAIERDAAFVVVHGNAPGADTLANEWCWDRRHRPGIIVEPHPAEWAKFGRYYAGPIRNQQMVNLGADLCLAFLVGSAENKGTRNCMGLARLAGIETKEFWT